MDDLEVGRVVPPEELERLMPLSKVPAEPATITEATEQGAKDAALYYAEICQVAFQQRSSELIHHIDWDQCKSCAGMIDRLDNNAVEWDTYWEMPQYEVGKIEHLESKIPFYRARIDFRWKRIVDVYTDSQEIRGIWTDRSNATNYAVAFYDGRWRLFYLQKPKEPDETE